MNLIAVLPPEGDYISPFKLVVFVLCVFLWAHNSSWVQADIKRIRIPPGSWVPMVFASGIAGLILWVILPNFWIGLLVFAIVYGGCILTYVFSRNKRVPPTDTVLSLAHLQRLGKGGGGKAKEVAGQDRVRIKDANGKNPPWPNEAEQREAYQEVQDLLFDAIWRRCTDVRLDWTPGQPINVFYRIDGVDRAREPIGVASGEESPEARAGMIVAHCKRIGCLNIDEHRKPQIGKFKATIGAGGKSGDKTVEVEVKTSGGSNLERVLLRMTSDEQKLKLSDIGLTKDQLAKVEALKDAKGVVVVAGPKASGVTTTMYAMLKIHDAYLQNIHTLEIGKLMDVENITQHIFDSQGGTVTFGKRFRSIIRTDPDIVMAGDTPDVETAQVAATAGKQGKRVYVGMTGKDVMTALGQYLQAVGDPALAGAGLLAVTNQRLLRVLCTHCRKAYRPDPSLLKKGNLPQGEDRLFYRPPNPNEVEVDKKGNPLICAVCQGSGYLGRTGVFEILFVDDALRRLIAANTPLANIKAEVRKKGMLFLQEVALHKVYEGITSIAEVLRVTKADESKSSARPSVAPAS